MKDKSELQIISKGVKEWNRWIHEKREESREEGSVVYSVDLEEVDLSGKNLSGIDLKNANLRSANLSEANLSSSNLVGANLEKAVLRSADASNSNIKSAKLIQTSLRSADFSNSDLRSSDLRLSDLVEANFEGADFRGSDLRNVNALDSKLEDADFRGISNSMLEGILMSGGRLRKSNLDKSGREFLFHNKTRYRTVSWVYLPKGGDISDKKGLSIAVGKLMGAMGFEEEYRGESVHGSWFKKIWYKFKQKETLQLISNVFIDAYYSLKSWVEGATYEQKYAEILSATAEVLEAVENQDDVKIRAGSIFISKETKDNGINIDVEILSPMEKELMRDEISTSEDAEKIVKQIRSVRGLN